MPLYVQNGKLIQKAGKLGTSAGCCCGKKYTACSCSGSPVIAPASMLLEVSLGALLFSSGTCTHADAVAFIEGTYVIPFWFSDGNASYYRTYLQDGKMVATFAWYCQSLNYSGGIANADFGIGYCNSSAACFGGYTMNYAYGPPGSSFWGGTMPALCNVTSGSTDSYANTFDDQNGFIQGPQACPASNFTNRRRYTLNVIATPSW